MAEEEGVWPIGVLGDASHGKGLMYRLPPVEGLPDFDHVISRALSSVRDEVSATQPGAVPTNEWEELLRGVATEIRRVCYHRMRFDWLVEQAKARRRPLGGPVVSDWMVAQPMYFEAAAFLGAARTVVDMIIYIAARRAGKAMTTADGWEPRAAIFPTAKKDGGTPPTKYDVPEVLELRKHASWFNELNEYRNAIHHRGWGELAFGYLSRGDTAEEASDPRHNVMLVPDAAALKARKRPHEWTYQEGRWLDQFIHAVDAELAEVVREISLNVWGARLPGEGTAPPDERPNVIVPWPQLTPIVGLESPPPCYVFIRKPAAKAFLEVLRKSRIEFRGAALRAVRPTLLRNEGLRYLFGYDAREIGEVARLKVCDHDQFGKLIVIQDDQFDPRQDNWFGVASIALILRTGHSGPVYVFAPTRASRSAV